MYFFFSSHSVKDVSVASSGQQKCCARDQRRLEEPREASVRVSCYRLPCCGNSLMVWGHEIISLAFVIHTICKPLIWLSDGHFLSWSETLVRLARLVLEAKGFSSYLKEFPLLIQWWLFPSYFQSLLLNNKSLYWNTMSLSGFRDQIK